MIYIYALADPRTQQIRYIGQTIDKEYRFNQHLSDKKITPKTIWLAELNQLDLFPIMIELGQCRTDKEAHDSELNWIYFGRGSGWDLTNIVGMKTEKYKQSYASFIGQKVWGKPFLDLGKYLLQVVRFLMLGQQPEEKIHGHLKVFSIGGTATLLCYTIFLITN